MDLRNGSITKERMKENDKEDYIPMNILQWENHVESGAIK